MRLQAVLYAFLSYPKFLYSLDKKLLIASQEQDEAFGFFMEELYNRFRDDPLNLPNIENLAAAATLTQDSIMYIKFLSPIGEFELDEAKAREIVAKWIWDTATTKVLPALPVNEGIGYLDTIKAAIEEPLTETSTLDLKKDQSIVGTIFEKLKVHKEFSTGIPQLDSIVKGGVGRQELGVLQAVTNTGKSWYTMNACLENAKRGYNTAYVSLEMGQDAIFTRLAMLLLHKTDIEIESNKEKTKREVLAEINKQIEGNFTIIRSVPRGFSIEELERQIRFIRLKYGYTLDFIGVDYDELMKLPRGDKVYERLTDLYVKFKALSERHDLGLFIAAQINREGAKSLGKTGLKDTSGSFFKVQIADLVVHLEEAEGGAIVMRVEKTRTGGKKSELILVPDFSTGELLGGSLYNGIERPKSDITW